MSPCMPITIITTLISSGLQESGTQSPTAGFTLPATSKAKFSSPIAAAIGFPSTPAMLQAERKESLSHRL